MGNTSRNLFSLQTSITLIALYPFFHFAAVWAGVTLSAASQTATLWISNALLLSMLLLFRRRWWPGVLAAAIVGEACTLIFITSDLPVTQGIAFSIANLLEAVIAAYVWQTLVSGRSGVSIYRLRDCVILALAVATLAPAISGTVAALGAVGLDNTAEFWKFWQLWWAAEALGILVIVPVLHSWATTKKEDLVSLSARSLELVALLLLLLGFTSWVFSAQQGAASTIVSIPYGIYPLLIWGVLRFGIRVSASLVLLMTVIATVYTNIGYGPFATGVTVYASVLSLQMFLASAAITALILAAVLEERAQLEARLIQSQKMEAIGQLTGGIAHDFNNILTSIVGYTDLAEMRAGELRDDDMETFLDGIRKGSKKASELVSQLLTFGRKGPARQVLLDLDDIVEDVLHMLARTMPSSLTVETAIAPGTRLVQADPIQLHQVLMNLCINARDATGGTGRMGISVETRQQDQTFCTSCQQYFSGNYACLEVRDDGPGLAMCDIGQVFDPFFTTKGKGQGTGLGLSVVHGAVHGCAGHIVVSSKPGATRFTAYLPLARGALPTVNTNETPAVAKKPAATLQGRVLIVDDEPAVAEVIAGVLRIGGLDVTVSTDPEEALALFRSDSQAYDVVVTDQIMPNLSGIELAQHLLSRRPDLPVILCSGFSEEVNIKRLHELGISDFFTKPIDFPGLLHRIGTLLPSKIAAEAAPTVAALPSMHAPATPQKPNPMRSPERCPKRNWR